MMSFVCGGGGTGEQWGCVAQGSESSKGNSPQMRNGMFKTSRLSGREDRKNKTAISGGFVG